MKIITLMDNITSKIDLSCEHGLSYYIETKNHKILFDTGKTDKFLDNAFEMGVDLRQVDLCFISHGHYDHTGGLKAFLEINTNAKVYINKNAFNDLYALRENGIQEYIGINKNIEIDGRFVLTEENVDVDNELSLFMNVKKDILNPESNSSLFEKVDGKLIQDEFNHEQNLIINENGEYVVFCGCAHSGVVNIVNAFIQNYRCKPKAVAGGFHLYRYCLDPEIIEETVKKTAEYFLNSGIKYYTGHCTGIESYRVLKSYLGNNIEYLKTGMNISI